MVDISNGLFVIPRSGRIETDPEWNNGWVITPADRAKNFVEVGKDLGVITDQQWEDLDDADDYTEALEGLLAGLGYTLLGEADVVNLSISIG
ncbi:UNVERIFIED_ORG: hypothetical protein FHR35_009169 [Microbispora rosea subsp. rosea]